MALGAAPAAHAKKKNISGTVFVSVPGFDPNSHVSLITGFVQAKKGCAAARLVRFALFNSDGTPVQAGQPAIATQPNGSIILALPEPPRPVTADDSLPYGFVVKIAVDGATLKKKGKKINCLPITGADQLAVAPGRPVF